MLSLASAAFGVSAWLWRRSQKLPEVRTPAVIATRTVRSTANEDAEISELESGIAKLEGLAGQETVLRPHSIDAYVFKKPKADALGLRESFRSLRASTQWKLELPTEEPPRYVAVVGGNLSGVERLALVDGDLVPQLRSTPGIRAVERCGGERQETSITFHHAMVAKLGLFVHDLQATIMGAPGESIRAAAAPPDLKTLLDLPLGANAKVRDLADVRLGLVPAECHASRAGSEELMMLRVFVGPNGEGSGALQTALDAFEKRSPRGVHAKLHAPRAKSDSAKPGQVSLRIPTLLGEHVRSFDHRLRELSENALSYALADDRGLEAIVDMPMDDGRPPAEFDRFLQTELAKTFGCVYTSRRSALRLRLRSGDGVLVDAKRFETLVKGQAGLAGTAVLSPALPRAFIPQRPRLALLGVSHADAAAALELAVDGWLPHPGMRFKIDVDWKAVSVKAAGGATASLGELFELSEESTLSGVRVDRVRVADLCITPGSLTPEELAARLIPLAKANGLSAEAERLSVR